MKYFMKYFMKYLTLCVLFLFLNACSDDSKSFTISDGAYRTECSTGTSSSKTELFFDGREISINEVNFENSDCSGSGEIETRFGPEEFSYSNTDLGNRVSYLTLKNQQDSFGFQLLFFIEEDKLYIADNEGEVLTESELKEEYKDFIEDPVEFAEALLIKE